MTLRTRYIKQSDIPIKARLFWKRGGVRV